MPQGASCRARPSTCLLKPKAPSTASASATSPARTVVLGPGGSLGGAWPSHDATAAKASLPRGLPQPMPSSPYSPRRSPAPQRIDVVRGRTLVRWRTTETCSTASAARPCNAPRPSACEELPYSINPTIRMQSGPFPDSSAPINKFNAISCNSALESSSSTIAPLSLRHSIRLGRAFSN